VETNVVAAIDDGVAEARSRSLAVGKSIRKSGFMMSAENTAIEEPLRYFVEDSVDEKWTLVLALWDDVDVSVPVTANQAAEPTPAHRAKQRKSSLQAELTKSLGEMLSGKVSCAIPEDDFTLFCQGMKQAETPWDWSSCRPHAEAARWPLYLGIAGVLSGIGISGGLTWYARMNQKLCFKGSPTARSDVRGVELRSTLE
jgi:hypothetical protein